MLNQLRIVIGLLVVAVLVYAGLWYTAAFQAEKDVAKLLSSWRNEGLIINHGRIEHGGFPYRITVNIDNLRVETRSKGLAINADSLLLISHLWTPRHWLAEAQNPVIEAAGGAIELTADTLLSSYRVHEGGQAVVAFSSETTTEARFPKLAGLSNPALEDWSLYLKFGSNGSEETSGLYGKTQLDFSLGARWNSNSASAKPSLVMTGNVSGPTLKDWNKKSLKNWAMEGGLVDIESLQLDIGTARARGNASLTLDDAFHLLGSGSLTVENATDLYTALAAVGIDGTSQLPTNGQLSVMAQNGTVSAESVTIARLSSILK